MEKYRVRKKHPPPSTIWDGEPINYNFKTKSRAILARFYESNKYPTAQERYKMAQEGQLTIQQVNNWFKNRRSRDVTLSHGPN